MKNFIKVLSFLIVFIFLNACQNQDETTIGSHLQKRSNLKYEEISFDQFSQEESPETLTPLSNYLDLNNLKKSDSDEDNFIIKTDEIRKITNNGYVSFTFMIENNKGNKDTFENLVILKLESGNKYYKIRYKKKKENSDTPYDSTIKEVSEESLNINVFSDFLKNSGSSAFCPEVRCQTCNAGYSYCHNPEDVTWLDGTTGQCSGNLDLPRIYDYSNCDAGGTGSDGGPLTTDDYGGGGTGGGGSPSGPTTSPIGGGESMEDTYELELHALNNTLSILSPYNSIKMDQVIDSIRLPQTDKNKEANEKFLCVYKKLVTSNTYRNLFVDVFGSNENLNVEFKVTKDLKFKNPNGNDSLRANGLTTTLYRNVNTSRFDMQIEIDEELLTTNSVFNILKTILHESIHAYINVQLLKCNPNVPYNHYDGVQLIPESFVGNEQVSDGLFLLYDNLCNGDRDQHELIFDYMLPVFGNIIDEIGLNNLASQQNLNDFANSSSLNWNDFKSYYPLQGLERTNAFKNTIKNNPTKFDLYDKYAFQSARMNKECN